MPRVAAKLKVKPTTDRPQNKNLIKSKKGERIPGAGRKKGTENKMTRDIKEAILMAASLSEHSETEDLIGYMVYLADKKQELYVSLLGRLIPLQAKVTSEVEHVIKAKPETQMTPQELADYYAKLRLRPANAPPLVIEHVADEHQSEVAE